MSKAWKHFETEGLLQLERGETLDPHFDTCEDSREARAYYTRLTERLAERPTERPPADWQQAVWRQVEGQAASTPQADDSGGDVVSLDARRRRRWLTGGGLGALAAAAALVLMLRPTAPGPADIGLSVTLEATAAADHRGGDARPGDSLLLQADLGSYEHAELRLYRDETELWLRCSTEPPCQRRGTKLEARIVLDDRGTYQPALMLSHEPLPTGGAGLDEDAGVALAAGAQVELGSATTVR